jgi:hypothetical protein
VRRRAVHRLSHRRRLGIYGFGAAAHIIAQVARYEGHEAFAFTRPGGRDLRPRPRRSLGPPFRFNTAQALRRRHRVRPRGRPGAGGPQGSAARRAGGLRRHSHEQHPVIPLRDPAAEREIVSVANLTRRDGHEFLRLTPPWFRSGQRSNSIHWSAPTRRSPTYARTTSRCRGSHHDRLNRRAGGQLLLSRGPGIDQIARLR